MSPGLVWVCAACFDDWVGLAAGVCDGSCYLGLQAQPHRQIHRLDVLGQGADRDIVHAGFGDCAQGAVVDAAGGFQFGAAGGDGYGLAHLVQAQLVEHDDVRSGLKRLLQFRQAFHFDFHRLAGGDLVGGLDGLGDAAAGGDMVFLDKEGIKQADAVVVAAAAGHSILLRQAQAGQGFAGVEQFHRGALHQVGIVLAAGGHGGQGLEEVQGAAFAAEQGAGRAFQVEQRLVRADPFAIAYLPVHGDTRVELAEYRVDPGGAGDHGGFASNDGGLGQALGGNQLRGDVAAADVFCQGAAHIGLDFAAEVVESEVGHGGLHWLSAPIIGIGARPCSAIADFVPTNGNGRRSL